MSVTLSIFKHKYDEIILGNGYYNSDSVDNGLISRLKTKVLFYNEDELSKIRLRISIRLPL